MAGANKPNHGNSIMKAIREATGANDQDIQLVLKECGNDVNEAVARLIDCTYLLDWFFEQTRGGIGSRGPSPPLQRAYVATYVVTYLFGPSRGENGSGRPRSGSPRHLRGPSIRTQQRWRERETPRRRRTAPLAHSLNRSARSLAHTRSPIRQVHLSPSCPKRTRWSSRSRGTRRRGRSEATSTSGMGLEEAVGETAGISGVAETAEVVAEAAVTAETVVAGEETAVAGGETVGHRRQGGWSRRPSSRSLRRFRSRLPLRPPQTARRPRPRPRLPRRHPQEPARARWLTCSSQSPSRRPSPASPSRSQRRRPLPLPRQHRSRPSQPLPLPSPHRRPRVSGGQSRPRRSPPRSRSKQQPTHPSRPRRDLQLR